MNVKIKMLIYGILIGLLIYLFQGMNINEIRDSLEQLLLIVLLVLILLQIMTQSIISIQWCEIMRHNGFHISFLKMLNINMKASIVEAITPGAKIGGEAYKTVELKRQLNCSMETSASLVAVQKVFSFIGLLFFAFLSVIYLIVNSNIVKSNGIWYFIPFILFGLLIGLIYVVRFPVQVANRMIGRNKISRIIKGFLLNYGECVSNLREHKIRMFTQIFLTFFMWLLYPVKLFIIMSVFGTVGGFEVFAITFTAYTVGTLPITPGGLGGFELTMTGLMVLLTSLSGDQAFVVAGVFRFFTFWMVIMAGMIMVTVEKLLVVLKNRKLAYHER